MSEKKNGMKSMRISVIFRSDSEEKVFFSLAQRYNYEVQNGKEEKSIQENYSNMRKELAKI